LDYPKNQLIDLEKKVPDRRELNLKDKQTDVQLSKKTCYKDPPPKTQKNKKKKNADVVMNPQFS
jgi:hypothetical protein